MPKQRGRPDVPVGVAVAGTRVGDGDGGAELGASVGDGEAVGVGAGVAVAELDGAAVDEAALDEGGVTADADGEGVGASRMTGVPKVGSRADWPALAAGGGSAPHAATTTARQSRRAPGSRVASRVGLISPPSPWFYAGFCG